MRLTYHTDYALRVLLYLAALPDTQRAHIQDIADAYAISSNHLMKIVHQLGRLGYIETTRGHNGGLRLARNPAEIRIGEVVRQTEEDFFLVECFDREHNCCVITPICHLRTALQEALAAFLSVLDRYTLADLSSNKTLYQQLISIPTSAHGGEH